MLRPALEAPPAPLPMHLLVIEDNPDIVANLYGYFEPLGHTLDSVHHGAAALELAARRSFDAIVLDLTLPGLDGLQVAHRLRREMRVATPILMLTARDTLADKLAGFEHGADDYLVKPFSLAELAVRLQALVRRARGEQVERALAFADLVVDTGTMQVMRAGRRVDLTPTGYRLLVKLMQAAPGVVTREALLQALWGDAPPDSDALRTHVHALRQAVDKPFARALVKTVQSVGWRLDDGRGGDAG